MNAFKELRKRAGLTQEAVSILLGLSKTAIQKWEYGESNPGVRHWPKIAEVYRINTDIIVKICEINKGGFVGSETDASKFMTESHRYASELLKDASEDVVKEVIKMLLT